MKFYCLTSVQLEEANNMTENETIKKFKNYCLTFIEIGPNAQRLNVFNFQREDAEKLSLLMKPRSITFKSINWKESDIIDLEFSDDANRSDKYRIKSMRISNIKITKNASVSDVERKKYYALISKLNDDTVFNNEKESKKIIKKAKFYNAKKSSENRLRDFQKLIETFCDPNSEMIEIPESAKYLPTATLKEDEEVYIDKHNYHQRKRDKKACWNKLTFNSATMTKFDDTWFSAINLTEFNLIDVTFTKTNIESWELFASGIEKLKFLSKFEIGGNFDELPDIVFKKLPVSLHVLILHQLKDISEYITELTNLRRLALIGNVTLYNIPWNYLPKSLKELELIGTGIIEIPHGISNLINLESFTFIEVFPKIPSYKYRETKSAFISWDSINTNIKMLHVSNAENYIDFKYCNFPMLEELKLIEEYRHFCYWDTFEISLLPKTLKKMSLVHLEIDFGLQNFNCNIDFPYLNELDLSTNSIEEFPFECITKPMAKINLSNNRLVKFEFNKNITNIKELDLSRNQICTITINETAADCVKNGGINLNIAGNKIEELPYGFEKLPISELNVGGNLLSFGKPLEIGKHFWKRLPENLRKLNISGVFVYELPCLLQNLSFLSEIIAIGCRLESICPRIFGDLLANKRCYLDIRENENIIGFPFAPVQIFPHIQNLIKPIKCEKEVEDYENLLEYFYDTPTITWTNYYNQTNQSSKILANKNFLSSQQTKTIDLTFKQIDLWGEVCDCCARCGIHTNEDFVEQLLTMDYELFQEEYPKNEEIICNYWPAKTWKTMVKTRFCIDCIEKYKKDAKELQFIRKRRGSDEKEVVDDDEVHNVETEQNPIGTIYTQPHQPCSSRRKFKKAQRRLQVISDPNDVDGNTQAAAQKSDSSDSDSEVTAGIISNPKAQHYSQINLCNVESTNSGFPHYSDIRSYQQNVSTTESSNSSFLPLNYQNSNHAAYQQYHHSEAYYPQQQQHYNQEAVDIMPSVTKTLCDNIQNDVIFPSSYQYEVSPQHCNGSPYVEPQNLRPIQLQPLSIIIPKTTLLEILNNKPLFYAAGKFDGWIEMNYELEGIMDKEFEIIRSHMDTFKL